MKRTGFFVIFISIVMSLCLVICGAEPKNGVYDAQGPEKTIVLKIGSSEMTVNGEKKPIDAEGTEPVIVNGRTLLPVRAVVEEIGGDVFWDRDSKEVILNCKTHEIILKIDSTAAYLNGEPAVLDVAPVILNGRTMLPIRFIAQGFGLDVDWNGEKKEITITKEKSINNEEENDAVNKINVQIGDKAYKAVLYDNETTRAWLETLPDEYSMNELNGNEKFYYLSERLPYAANNPGTINTGDIMLYGSDCIVLFYKTFQTSYSYTKIGYMENAENLEKALGSGSVEVKFEK